jgi:DNA-directed RNA polymerase specialized sigma24 family protein
VSGQRLAREDPAGPFLDLYDRALPQVYGYLLSRCGQRAVAEDLTAETFLAAVDVVRGVRGPAPATLSTGWLIGVARHKLSDHWRRQAREERTLRAVAGHPVLPRPVPLILSFAARPGLSTSPTAGRDQGVEVASARAVPRRSW